jgi:hypothetical protein
MVKRCDGRNSSEGKVEERYLVINEFDRSVGLRHVI